ncbi:alpha/beta hydrolase fold domain-containing protein [Pseudonocardia sp. TRM90224]|uniref:alpha/beta hydrolase fold domain-containing protein n=1 Tax=Pseudonocardia sp. TRM90224 TaxID=2812678 RepID=UPI00272E24B9|nr:alpha/beta hydrolase fold domain-containing protein [Pseudonocardia sp. TRM90224]
MDDPTPAPVLALSAAPDAIELRHLRAFVTVAEELNFSRAAARLYLSQPALSRQIRMLERLLGAELLRRSTHRVELTLAGEAFRPSAEELLGRLDDAVTAVRAVGGELIGRAARHLADVRAALGVDADVQSIRDAFEALHAQFAVPEGIAVRPLNTNGVASLLVARDPAEPATVLYVHGGGHITGSAFGYRPFAGAFATAAEAGLVVPEYRLAPEHPFPAGVEDAVRAYAWMVERSDAPERIVVAGDSSGAAMVLSLLLSLAGEGLPMPGGAVLLCPSIDLTAADIDPGEELGKLVRRSCELYLAGHPADDPLVNPLLADLTGLPPMLVQSATGDLARRETERFVERARAHDVDARLELYPADTHAFQLFWSFLPEAAEALQRAGTFVREIQRAADVRTA